MKKKKLRVLVVDDQRDMRIILVAGLESLSPSLDIIDVPSAEEAYLVSSQGPVALVITDLRLPGMSGLDLVKRLQTRYPEAKTILITGATDHKSRAQVEESGANAYFYKPLEMAEFLASVQSLLDLEDVPLDAMEKSIPQGEWPVVVEKTTGPLESMAVFEPEAISAGNPLERLRILCEQTHGQAALLLDAAGEIVLQVGDTQVPPMVLEAIQANVQSGWQAASVMGAQPYQNLLYFGGVATSYCVLLAQPALNLLFVVEGVLKPATLGAVFHHLQVAAPDLEQLLAAQKKAADAEAEALGLLPSDAIEEALEVELTPEDLAAAETLFAGLGEKSLKTDELDAFWDSLAEETGSLNLSEKSISFDEARDMGLAPE